VVAAQYGHTEIVRIILDLAPKTTVVGRCRLKRVETSVESAGERDEDREICISRGRER
jgi:hypothetical protein